MQDDVMNNGRRLFLKQSVAAALVYGAGGLPGLSGALSADFAAVTRPMLANLSLLGGPDFRHLFPPSVDSAPSSYGHQFWLHRQRALGIGSSTSAWDAHWQQHYAHRQAGAANFGILNTCEWLVDMWDAGNLAIVNNVVGGQSRDHDHCILIMDQGIRSSGPNDHGRSGWGGRLASALGANVVSLTHTPREFCNGAHPSGDITQFDNSNRVSAADMRRISLYEADPERNPRYDRTGQFARTMKSYYAWLRQDLDTTSAYRQFVDHEASLRDFGTLISERLANVAEPQILRDLYTGSSPNRLRRTSFGKQIRNLYDAIACNDILDMQVASIEYGGWDTHDSQRERIEGNFNDLFGRNKGFDALWQALPEDAKDRLVITISGEFGRQLKDNGGNGTDHGRGNAMLVIGRPVSGGVYGDMFPQEELQRLTDRSPDIRGQTDMDRLFGSVCDWMLAGTGNQVFPDVGASALEPGVNFAGLFQA